MEKSRSVHSPDIPTVRETRLSRSSAASHTSGGEKEEKEEAEMEGNQLKDKRVARGSNVQRGYPRGSPLHSWGYQHPLTRASSISAKQNPFSFKQDISPPPPWCGLVWGLALCLPSSRSQGSRGLQPYPHLPFSALETHCQRDSLFKRTDGGPRSHSLLLVPFVAV